MTIRRGVLIVLSAMVVFPANAGATLGGKIAGIVGSSHFSGAGTSISIYDDTRNRFVYLHNGFTGLKPASNMKLTTAVAALGRIGAAAQLRTNVVIPPGSRNGSTVNGGLFLVGGGDPTFSTSTYSANRYSGASALVGHLAKAVRAAGIRRVTGRVWGVESRFDTRRTAPYWLSTYWEYCPPISALSVNQGWRSFGSRYSYANQALRAATVFRGALQANGVRVALPAATGKRRPDGATVVATELSPPMYRLVKQMNVPSDNFHAEVLNKNIAVARGLAGTTANGRYVTRNYLDSIGVGMVGARMYDGSGLSIANRLSSRHVLSLLLRVKQQSYVWWFQNSLPIAGVNGTLQNRMTSGPAFRNARAKTGTLRDASALSGYVRSANGHQLVFSIIVNRGPYLDITGARALQDRIVQTLAGSRPL